MSSREDTYVTSKLLCDSSDVRAEASAGPGVHACAWGPLAFSTEKLLLFQWYFSPLQCSLCSVSGTALWG